MSDKLEFKSDIFKQLSLETVVSMFRTDISLRPHNAYLSFDTYERRYPRIKRDSVLIREIKASFNEKERNVKLYEDAAIKLLTKIKLSKAQSARYLQLIDLRQEALSVCAGLKFDIRHDYETVVNYLQQDDA